MFPFRYGDSPVGAVGCFMYSRAQAFAIRAAFGPLFAE